MGIKNTLTDVHNMLMEQMELIRDCESAEELNKEIQRSKAMSDVAGQIISNGRLMLDAAKLSNETWGGKEPDVPKCLKG